MKYIIVTFFALSPYISYWFGGGNFERNEGLGMITFLEVVVLFIIFILNEERKRQHREGDDE
jgi:hypothetical protein